MRFIPKALLRQLYNRGSLRNAEGGVHFVVKNRLVPASVVGIDRVAIDGVELPRERVSLHTEGGRGVTLDELGPASALEFPLGRTLTVRLAGDPLAAGRHEIELAFETAKHGTLELRVRDELASGERSPTSIPRDAADDYGETIVRARQAFVRERTGAELTHTSRYSIDPQVTRGNIEQFLGATQVPLGVAGPLLVHGQHAKGEFYVPLATSEGTLVASYNRGMRVLRESGGVRCAVVGDAMQRAPVFVFEDAAAGRRFVDWIAAHIDELKAVCAETDPFVRLTEIDPYLAHKFAFLRFNFTTGDAAGMNMVGKATFAACNWIIERCDAAPVERFYLESNLATDKKASMVNLMRTRGKRVTAEAVVKRDVLADVMDADTEALAHHWRVASIGTQLSGATNNGCHSANAITAIFLATGQDVANVSESSVALLFTELTPENDLYISITLPSLIVATRGGGTGLPTQREALALMGCDGPGTVKKLAEIVAGTVLAGEISLAAAISSLDWVSSHDALGRNDPLAG